MYVLKVDYIIIVILFNRFAIIKIIAINHAPYCREKNITVPRRAVV